MNSGAASGAGVPIYLIGGTSEAHRAVARLRAAGFQVTVSVVTDLGAARSRAAASADIGARLPSPAGTPPPPAHMLPRDTDTGPKDAVLMARRATELGAAAIVDCSHPFAVMASREARAAAARAGLPYLRFSRPALSVTGPHVIRVRSWEEALQVLKDRPGRALLTVGVRILERFVDEHIEFTARVLPLAASLAECDRLGLDAGDIIAAHPPFSVEFNRACISHAHADILVTKESGQEGGLREKEAAAAAEGIDLMMVERPEEPDAIQDLDQLVSRLTEVLAT
ncbi:MAG: precorrin-6A reductase [Thermoleophilia bacterium]